MWAKFRNNFIAGLAILLPAIVSIWLLLWLTALVDNRILEPTVALFKPYLPHLYFEYLLRVLLFIALVLAIVVIGFATRIILLRKFFLAGEKVFFKIPMLGKVYLVIKDVSRIIFGERKGGFNSTVLVEYPKKGVYSIGFLTSPSVGDMQSRFEKKMVNVFVPTAPNPTSGFLILVPEDDVIRLDMGIEDAMKVIISAGMFIPGKSQDA